MSEEVVFSKKVLEDKSQIELLDKEIDQSITYVESSGTSGIRGYGWYSEQDLEKMSNHLINKGVQLSENDTIMIRFPYTLSLPAHLIEASARKSKSIIVPVSSRTEMAPYFKLLSLMKELEVTVFAGNPREIEFLFEALSIQQLSPKEYLPKLRAFVTAGEVLSYNRKNYIELNWGVEVFNLYGATEVGNFGYTCKYGMMHIDEENFQIEKEQEGAFYSLSKGLNKNVYITNKSNCTSKIRNYEIEDIIEVLSEECSCGDSNTLIQARGRLGDVIKISEKEIDMYDIQEAIYALNEVPFFWEVHVKDEDVEIRMEYNIDKSINRSEVEQELKDKLELLSIKVLIFKEGELVNRGEIFKYPRSRKPIYIYNSREKKIQAEIELGKQELQNKNYKKAKLYFKNVIKEYDFSEAYIWLAAAIGLEADSKSLMEKITLYPSLKKYTELAIQRNPYDSFAHYLLGMLLYKTPEEIGGNRKKALNHFRMSKYLGYKEDISVYIEDLT
ncbi:MAG: hypothetical protein LBM95_02630 [Lactobacillales bacterium]|nr:hypothetical protein [Lactobacillales bacterium]